MKITISDVGEVKVVRVWKGEAIDEEVERMEWEGGQRERGRERERERERG